MIGQQLSGRYEILNRVGGGGMALVFKAHDKLLNRMVAIKVLRQQFVYDEDFIRRFRREAQSAASLSHPNVVSIYDVGQEDDIHYIVMEYIEGSNLNEEIKNRAPFQVDEAIHITCQICDALDHAHQNQIIHRDIKPHNILIGKNGRVKVTDFGIARAASSSEITQTGSVLGSVHYFSPEHAKGVTQGAKSDLYSLGIVLYQMLTNKLPFSGESPISIALKHLQEDVEEPRKVNPLIPQSVENIVLKSMQKNPEQRYQSASQMFHDLESCLLPEKMNENKVQFNDDLDDEEHTKIMPVIGLNRKVQEMDHDETITPEHREGRKKRNRLGWIKPVIWTFTTIIILFSAWFGVKAVLGMLDVSDVEVPNVVGKTLEEATKELENVQLRVLDPVQYEYDDQVKEGIVIDQSDKNKTVKVNFPITLTVSQGQETKIMQDYKGMQWVDVENALRKIGFSDEDIKMETELSDVPDGEVISQSPEANIKFNPNDVVVSFIVSEGLGSVTMPNLIKYSEEAAVNTLEQKGLKVIIEKDFDLNVNEGYVFKQHPYEPEDTLKKGEEITIFVSKGEPEDVRRTNYRVFVEPEVQGEDSVIEFKITDALGTDRIGNTKTIKEEETFFVPIVLTSDLPDGKAYISVYRDAKHLGTYEVKYDDYK
ncbi:Stk1 family PASTA domain-containing Ser/Thr kinase [Chengkuizengella sediminis]|uniref:Stk1 family PASTA domain-containing Ser/Thr kinase n=1 Tax=Chengkuizengella sediminis TaxID=1885917 RepID=UPI00138A297D|nr:Stk1 family PASTA domain-containing Ser/Thr kinase [Chengkuizengella sediminis]NDI33465.1 Stk1 family PASTA domain-containing Ser/Thr kinase [Chengkuizengella sediminis]